MKDNIPSVNEFVDYYKFSPSYIPDNRVDLIKHLQKDLQWFERMETVSWADIKSLSPEELLKVPACWIYDWCHVTANYNLQDEVEVLYKRYNLPIYTIEQYLSLYNITRV